VKSLRDLAAFVAMFAVLLALVWLVQRCTRSEPPTGPCVTVHATNDDLTTCPDPRQRAQRPDPRTLWCVCPADGGRP
jgi:hypothetical protein